MQNNSDSDLSNGTSSSPNGEGSLGKGDSSGSVDALKLQSTIEALTKKLDEVDARSKALQSDKDRGITKTKSEVDDLKRKIAEIEKLKRSGLDEDGAIEELSFREEIRSIRDQLSKLNQAQPETAGNGKSLVEEVQSVFNEFGVDPNTPEAISLYNLKGTDLVKGVAKLAIKNQSKPTYDSSEATSLSGSPSKNDKTIDDLTKQYQKDILATPRGKSGDSARKALKEQAKKNGVPVDSIAFV